jgi:hypothetical protein
VVLLVTVGRKGRPAAPPGKDADPKESLWDFEGRGRRLAVIDGCPFRSNVAGRATARRTL